MLKGCILKYDQNVNMLIRHRRA